MMTGNQFAGWGWVMTKNPSIGIAKATATTVARIAASAARPGAIASTIFARPQANSGGGRMSGVLVPNRRLRPTVFGSILAPEPEISANLLTCGGCVSSSSM